MEDLPVPLQQRHATCYCIRHHLENSVYSGIGQKRSRKLMEMCTWKDKHTRVVIINLPQLERIPFPFFALMALALVFLLRLTRLLDRRLLSISSQPGYILHHEDLTQVYLIYCVSHSLVPKLPIQGYFRTLQDDKSSWLDLVMSLWLCSHFWISISQPTEVLTLEGRATTLDSFTGRLAIAV